MLRRYVNNGVLLYVDDNGGAGRRNTVNATDPLAGVTRDAASGIYFPSSSAEWTSFLAAAGLTGVVAVPNSLWLCQEASGNLADSIGSLTLTAANTPGYQTTATGFTRKGVSATAGSNQRFSAAAGVGPDPSTTSTVWMWWIDVTAVPGATRQVACVGGALSTTDCSIQITTGSKARSQCVAITADGTVDVVTGGARPFWLEYDRANSETSVVHNGEVIAGTYSSLVSDSVKGIFNGNGALSAASTIIYGAMWSGANAEAITNAHKKTMMQTAGVTVAW